MKQLRKRTVDKVIKECFWEGFQQGLGDGLRGALEYASTSGLYSYNPIRSIALDAGYDEAQRLFKEHIVRLNTGRRWISMGYEYKVPNEVYNKCYIEAGLLSR